MKTWRMSEMTDVHTHNTLHCNVILCPRPLDNCDVSKLKTKKYPSEICWASQYKCAIPALGRLRHEDKELIDSVYHVGSLRPGCITRKNCLKKQSPGWWSGSAWCHQAWWPELKPQNPHAGSKELTRKLSSDSHMHHGAQAHAHTHKQISNKHTCAHTHIHTRT